MQPPDTTFVPDFVPNPDQIFWDLMAEFYDAQNLITMHSPGHRRLYAAMHRKPRALDIARVFRMDNDELPNGGSDGQCFTPTVGMLAGLIFQRFGIAPDVAAIQLYRDGADHCAYHADSEIMAGPEPGRALITILSFGATRRLSMRPSGIEADDEVEHTHFDLPPGSLFVMDGTTQRNHYHSIPEAPSCRSPRISVTFLFRQRGDSKDLPWLLLRPDDTDSMTPARPVYSGPPEELAERWEELRERGRFVACNSEGRRYHNLRDFRAHALGIKEARVSEDAAALFNDGVKHLIDNDMLPDPTEMYLGRFPADWLRKLKVSLDLEVSVRDKIEELSSTQEEKKPLALEAPPSDQ